MATSPQFSNENFSSYQLSIYSSSPSSFDDTINGGNNSSFNSINGGGSFFEVDPHFLDFDFDLPRSQSPPPLVNSSSTRASSIMSRDRSTSSKPYGSRRSSRRSSSAIFHSAQSTPNQISRHHPVHLPHPPLVMRSCIKSPKKILSKYLSFLIPFYKKVRSLKFKAAPPPSKQSRSCKDSVRSSSTRTTAAAFSSFEWCRSNSDISIYDAILYCKRSNGQDS